MKYILPRKYLSASAIGTFLRCPMQYKFRYVDGVVSPPNVVALKGKSLHKGHELYFEDVLSGSRTRIPAEGVAELSIEAMEQEAEENGLEIAGEDKDEAAKEFYSAADSYINGVADKITPRLVEQEIKYTARCGVPILGYVDLIREPMEGEEEDEVLADYKLTGKKWNIKQLQNSIQFNLYAMATGINNIEIHNIVRGSKKPKKLLKEAEGGIFDIASNLRILKHHFKGNDFDHIENLIESVALQITSGIFPPCDLDAWCCNETWCGYWYLCRGSLAN